MVCKVKTIALCVGLLCVISTYGYAYEEPAFVPSDQEIKETKTEHFHIIFNESLQNAVSYLAEQCEQAYRILTPIFGWYPQERIEVLFLDARDTHNGWATPIPHNRMAIYAAGAEPGSTIFQPGNYLQRTVFHELTHVLSMDMRYGYNRIFSGIFGKMLMVNYDPLSSLFFYFTVSPVALAPTWYLEGIAIWAETEFAPPGRGRGSIPDMIFRCAIQEMNFLPYPCWDLDIPYWPYRLGAYLYGAKLLQHINENSTAEEPIGELTKSIAQAFMFNFESRSKKVTGERFQHLFKKMFLHEKEIQRKNIEELKKLAPTEMKRLTNPEIIVYQPVFMRNQIYFSAREEDARDSLYVYKLKGKKTQKIGQARTTAAFGSLIASPDRRYVYYTRLEIQRKNTHRYEVRRFDTKSQKDTLITDKGRYRAIDISPDGHKLVAVSMRAGVSFLVEVPLALAGNEKEEKVLAKSSLQQTFSSPRYSPDGHHITFVRGDKDGFSIIIYDLKKNIHYKLYESEHQILFPTWHPHRERIVFSSDENGVYNLYEIETDGTCTPQPLTHVLGGVFASDFDSGGNNIAAVGYDSKGYYLAILPYNPQILADQQLPRIHTTWKGKKRIKKQTETLTAITPAYNESHPYSSFKNIQFDYWGPWFTARHSGVEGGIGAVFSDPTGYQNIRFIAGIESEYETPLGAFQYAYKGLYPTLYVHISQDQELYPYLLREAGGTFYDYAEEVLTVRTGMEIPLIRWDRFFSMQFGYQFQERNFIEKSGDYYRGQTITTNNLSEKSEGAIWARLQYFDGAAFKRSNSIEDGRLVMVTTEKTDPALGGTLSQIRSLGEWNEYISNPWKKNHVLKISGLYGFGDGDRTAQGLFGLGGFESPLPLISLGMPRSVNLQAYDENFQTGDRIVKASLAYRFPIDFFYENISGSAPLFFNQIFGEIFYEGGRTWDDEDEGDDLGWLDSIGLEVNLSFKLFRFLEMAPGLGVLYAPDWSKRSSNKNKQYQIYFTVKGSVNY